MMRTVWLVAVLAVVGCGGDSGKAPFIPRGSKDAGPNDAKDASTSKDKDAGPSDGPELSFTMPEAANDPNDDTVITSSLVTVHCRATRRSGEAKVDESTVAITLEKFDQDSKEEVKPATTKVGDGEFEAKFDVSNRLNGVLKFICTAKDSATPAKTSTRALTTFLDLGPHIELQEPQDKSIYALETPVVVKFKVAPDPVADNDKEADVKEVKLLISGTEHEITESDDAPGTYQTTVDFGDKKLFMVPPTSAEILVTATNARTPEPVTRAVKADVMIDGDGPSIKVESPAHLSIVHGEVLIKLTITDPSGVKADSVRAEVNLMTITEWDIAGDSYSATFDTRGFGTELTQLNIDITATDVVGNQKTVPHMLRLDNVPPVISLDPPFVREWRPGSLKGTFICSEAFDPIGEDAKSDGDTATVSSIYRAVVMDETKSSPGASASYFAGVAENTVELFAQKDPTVPLLIDTNGDKFCDEINFANVPESKRPKTAHLTALAPRGSSWFSKTVVFNEPPKHVVQPADGYCMKNDNQPDPPGRICGDTFLPMLPRVVAGQSEKSPPALFALNPSGVGAGSDCAGGSWELIPSIGEGWRCLAVRAEDKIGNIGISAPLRVCFDDSSNTATPCANPGPRPSCTDGCTMKESQLYPANAVWHE